MSGHNWKPIKVPILIGDKVYKICPVCNDQHVGSCQHCAWRGCHPHGCDVGVRVWSDGSCEETPLQIIERVVTRDNYMTVLDNYDTMYFGNIASAKLGLSTYEYIRNIPDKHERYEHYKHWVSAMGFKNPFYREGQAQEDKDE